MNSALTQARRLLDGTLKVPVHSVRAAAWLTRAALEDAVAELVRVKGCDPGRANMRTLLGCVEVLYETDTPQLAAQAQYAWDALSQAAHHHAYELAPTHAEVSALTELVGEIAGKSVVMSQSAP